MTDGDLAAVQRWYTTYAQHKANVPRPLQEQEVLLVARMHLAQGEAESALPLLEAWQTESQAQGRVRINDQAHLPL